MRRTWTIHTTVGACLALTCAMAAQAKDHERVASEDDYFGNVPVVLTASRLDQPLNEAPGAITVIDRNTIRLTGARTVAEVLRLVPGYLSGGRNGANPGASYHIPLDDFGTRNLVLIDGRSVYSSVHVGDTHRGMLDVMVEDIERIEVLRGANSAAYGANAMFGVINIITRHSADTIGTELSFASGNTGIRDRRVRVGGGDENASFRLSAGDQRDTGYFNAFDDKNLSQLHGRIDFKPNFADDLMLTAGVSYLSAGEGFPDSDGNPLHTIHTRDSYANLVWRRQLSSTDELQVSANYMEDWKDDDTPSPLLPSVLLDFGGIGRRTNLEVQRKMALNPEVRAVFGAGYKREEAKSQALYARDDWIGSHEERVFGTLEWRVTPQWLLNTGLFVGQQSLAGGYTAPRLMVNWLPSPEHTFRAGITDSYRPPSLYEYSADVRYYNEGVLLAQTDVARGSAHPEKLHSQEVGYQGRFPSVRLTLDVRAYHERMTSVIQRTGYELSYSLPVTRNEASSYENQPGLDIAGVEYQMRWKPFEASEIWINQSFSHMRWDDEGLNAKSERMPPEYATTVAWFQGLPGQWRLSVIYQYLGSMTWRDDRDLMRPTHRTDVRLAYPFRIGPTKAEAAITVQSAEGDQAFFLPSRGFESPRRTFLTLRLEF